MLFLAQRRNVGRKFDLAPRFLFRKLTIVKHFNLPIFPANVVIQRLSISSLNMRASRPLVIQKDCLVPNATHVCRSDFIKAAL